MSPPLLPTGPALVRRRRPIKRESAPGKVRQLKESADGQDVVKLREQSERCKSAANGKGDGRE